MQFREELFKQNLRSSDNKNIRKEKYDFIDLINRLKTLPAVISPIDKLYRKYAMRLNDRDNPGEIKQLLNDMLNKGLFPNAQIISLLIKKLGKFNLSAIVYDIYLMAVEKQIANTVVYNCMLRTINSTLDVIAKSNEPDSRLAFELFQEARQNNLANGLTYACMLDVLAKSTKLDRVLARYLLDEITGRGLIKLGSLENIQLYDLHGLTFGVTYFWLLRELSCLLACSNKNEIALIYGNASHRRFARDTHPLKEAVQRVIDELGIYSEEDRVNTGLVRVMLVKPCEARKYGPQELQSDTYTSGFFSSKQAPVQLNPLAEPFVPMFR